MAYIPEIATLADVPRHHADKRPESPAIVFDGRTTTYAEWGERCMKVANALIADGVEPGRRIAYLDINRPEYFEILYGGAVAGAVTVAVNWRLAAPEISYILNDARAEILFVGEDLFPVVDQMADDLKTVRKIVAMSGSRTGWPAYAGWRDAQPASDPKVAVDPESAVLQMYTSGTTGHPKGVQLSHRAFYALDEARSKATPDPGMAWNEWTAKDVSLVTMPVFHISGTGWGVVGLYNGAKNVVLEQFEPGAVLDTIQNHGVTKLVLVPAAIQMTLLHPKCKDTDFSSIDYFLYGASPIPLDLLAEAVKMFRCGFVQLYGMTEVCGAVTYLPADDHVPEGNQRMRSAGKAIPGARISIRDESGAELPPGEVGEICIQSPSTMIGYWNLPEETAKTIGDDGWLRSGDAGYMDEDGYVYIHDRVKDMIVSGGENIYPAEVENAIHGHEGVLEVAVIGVPDQKWGEAVKAIVVRKSGTDPTPEDIIAFARKRIAGYKVPKSVDFIDELPRNPSGKILKRDLREPYWAGKERRVN